MDEEVGIRIRKPVSFWLRDVKVKGQDLWKPLFKAAKDGALQDWGGLYSDALDVVSAIGLKRDEGDLAWMLVYGALGRSVGYVVASHRDLLDPCLDEQVVAEQSQGFVESIERVLETANVVITAEFFDRPERAAFLEHIISPFAEWLGTQGLDETQSLSIAERLPRFFPLGLQKEWGARPSDYRQIRDKLKTPFSEALQRELAWRAYESEVKQQVDERIFDEAFSLSQVYVPLRAYFEVPVAKKADKPPRGHDAEESQETVNRVVDLTSHLAAWADKKNPDDAIRIISGGPGCGKSAFVKMFAKEMLDNNVRVLLVPLHRYTLGDSLDSGVETFARDNGLPFSPLDPEKGFARTMIIFDGLDELSQRGSAALEQARKFVDQVSRRVEAINAGKQRLVQVLMSGRELVVQGSAEGVFSSGKLLHFLPYYLDEYSTLEYADKQGLLKEDQREPWWRLFSERTNTPHKRMVDELKQDALDELTAHPLLSYLVARAYRGGMRFIGEANRNNVYQDLLQSVFARGRGGTQQSPRRVADDDQSCDPRLGGMVFRVFKEIMEQVAVSAWHHNGRTASARDITERLERPAHRTALKKLEEEEGKGLTGLLLAFYFRQAGSGAQGDPAFEFTHKSFQEYLTACRIVRLLEQIHRNLEKANDPRGDEDGWNLTQALEAWAGLCGPQAMDRDLLRFIQDEVRTRPTEHVQKWQRCLCRMIEQVIRKGMPMEKLGLLDYWTMQRNARNAEEALLAVLSACASHTRELSRIEWPSPTTFGTCILRLTGQRMQRDVLFDTEWDQPLASASLAWLALDGCFLAGHNLANAVLLSADLAQAILHDANLKNANLEETDLRGANLKRADLDNANLKRADLSGASLLGANLEYATLRGANLRDADLRLANLEEADLRGANLSGANLVRANLERADLSGASLMLAHLTGARFWQANLTGTILEGSGKDKIRPPGFVLEDTDEDDNSETDAE